MIRNHLIAFTICAVTLAANAHASAQTIQVNRENRTIAITATDRVLVMADTATVHIGFLAYGPDSDSAYATGSRISNAIVKALTSAGIPSDTIQSENQNVAPVQEYQIDKLTPRRESPAKVPGHAKLDRPRPRRQRRQNPRPRRQSRSQPVRPDRMVPQGRERPSGRSRRQGPPARPHRSLPDGRRHERQTRTPPLRQQRDPGLPRPPSHPRHGSGPHANG